MRTEGPETGSPSEDKPGVPDKAEDTIRALVTELQRMRSGYEGVKRLNDERASSQGAWQIGGTVASIVLSALTLWVLYKTWGATSDLVTNANSQARIMAAQATIAARQEEITEKTLPAMQEQASAALAASRSNQQMAAASVSAAQTASEALRVSESGQLANILVDVTCSTKILQPDTEFSLTLRNIGQTSATQIRGEWGLLGVAAGCNSGEFTIPQLLPGQPAVQMGLPKPLEQCLKSEGRKGVLNAIKDHGGIGLNVAGYVSFFDAIGKLHRSDINFTYIGGGDCQFLMQFGESVYWAELEQKDSRR